ncbi:hypothetical protein OGAPHI_001297 [Ogataea philodendri]|uniref:C2H2-type domain-containing protein n=1 Tax=Ogataea philodendri TaxID=1378263 RepID=A0A9P8PF67_9ASCO|nr:uncharacterized protein OGAPHI_001297 [Ogataea philodendri]KAH3670781.1 hypothetical protein OGAPHI_001297 [Ogataea philodendri]
MSPRVVKDLPDRYEDLQCFLFSETETVSEFLKCCYDPSHLLAQEACKDDDDDDQSECCFDYCCFDNCVDAPSEQPKQESGTPSTPPDEKVKLEFGPTEFKLYNRDGELNLTNETSTNQTAEQKLPPDMLGSQLPCANVSHPIPLPTPPTPPSTSISGLESREFSQTHHHHMQFEDQYNGNVIRHDIIIPSNIHWHIHNHHLNHPHYHTMKDEELERPHKKMKMETKDQPSLFNCKWDGCQDELDSSTFNQHLLDSHLTQKTDVYDCGWQECPFTADNLDDLLAHAGIHLEKTPPLAENLDLCKPLPAHICQWEHKDGSVCGKEFASTSDLTNHVIDIHVQSKKSEYTCCWKNCTREHKPFSQRQKIIRHLNTHTKHKPFVCHYCMKSFSLELMLEQHLRTHTGETPFKCNICGKEFKTSSSFIIHQRIHTGEKPLECQVCGKKFRESSNLNKHMKIHSRKFKCDCCMRSFDKEAKYLKHLELCQKGTYGNKNCICKGDMEADIKISV